MRIVCFEIYFEIRATDFLERLCLTFKRVRKDCRVVGVKNGKLELLCIEVNKNKDETDLMESISC